MQSAGRILLMPKGDYSASVTYEMLDLVNHNGASWVCKKDCTGQEPSGSNTEFWQWFGADNAKTLDGHGAEYFVNRVDLRGQLQTTDYRRSVIALCEVGKVDVTIDSMSFGTVIIHRSNGLRPNEALVNVLFSARYGIENGINAYVGHANQQDVTIKACIFTYNGKTYGGLEIYMASSYSNNIEFIGTTNFDIFGIDYYDTRNNVAVNEEIANSISYDKTTISPFFINGEKVATEADLANYLPLTGGTVTGDIILKPSGATGYGKIGKWASATADNGTIIRDEDFNGYNAIVRIRAGKGLNGFLYEVDGGIYNVLHTGNKPSGTYTGNGDATARTIAIGGIGETLRIFNTTYGIAFIGKYGGVGIGVNGITTITSGECKLENGVLTMASTSNFFNANTYTYEYDLL